MNPMPRFPRRAPAATLALVLGLAAGPRPAAAGEDLRQLVERDHFRAARALVEPRVTANPNDAEAQWLWSQILAAYHDDDRAMAAAEKAVALEPGRAEYHTQLAMISGQRAGSAGPLKLLGLAKRCHKEAEAALAIDPGEWDARTTLLMFFVQAPGVAGGDKKKALALAEEGIKLDACRGWLLRARYAAAVKDTNSLEGFYRKAVAANPQDYEAHMSLAGWLAQHSQWSASETEARLAQASNHWYAGSYSLLAQIYAKNSRWSDLDAELAAAATAVPGNLSAQYSAARLLVMSGEELPRAERYLRGYLEVEPEAGAPSHAGAHWRLGTLFEKQGKKNEALAEYETAVRLDPKLEAAKKDLSRLKKS